MNKIYDAILVLINDAVYLDLTLIENEMKIPDNKYCKMREKSLEVRALLYGLYGIAKD